jgi:hypothetical protein
MDIVNFLRAQWDRSLAVAAVLFAGLALLMGYLGISGTPHVAAQLPYFISGGLFGIFMLTIAATLWVSADLRDEWRELRALRVRLDSALEDQQEQPAGRRRAEAVPETVSLVEGLPATAGKAKVSARRSSNGRAAAEVRP